MGGRWAPEKRNAYMRKYMQKRRLALSEKAAGRPAPDRCELCGEGVGQVGHRMNFDHDHKTGEFRGWLCHRCNRTLGFVCDDVLLLHKMILYLQGKLK